MNVAYPKRFFDGLGLGFAAGHSAALPVCLMNRRVRNRIYGDVRGRQE